VRRARNKQSARSKLRSPPSTHRTRYILQTCSPIPIFCWFISCCLFFFADTSDISVISPTFSFSLQYPFRASSRPPRLRDSNLKFCDIYSSEETLRLCCNRKRRRPPLFAEQHLKILESENKVSRALGYSQSRLIRKNEQRCEARQHERIQRSVLSLHVRNFLSHVFALSKLIG
jgi:hypothetical protein